MHAILGFMAFVFSVVLMGMLDKYTGMGNGPAAAIAIGIFIGLNVWIWRLFFPKQPR
jgi:hypothetical protein